MNLSNFLNEAIYWVPALIIALSFHEYAHGKMADYLGDPTPRQHGRLTLNPIKHIDPVGLLMLMIVRFGWAKPVPVNPFYFRGDRRRGMILVAAAGPGTNFFLATLAGLGFYITFALSLTTPALSPVVTYLHQFFSWLLLYNVFLGVFNLLPVPPLDGSKILFNILPPRYSRIQFELERYGFLILMLMLITGAHRLFLEPVAYAIINWILSLTSQVLRLFI